MATMTDLLKKEYDILVEVSETLKNLHEILPSDNLVKAREHVLNEMEANLDKRIDILKEDMKSIGMSDEEIEDKLKAL